MRLLKLLRAAVVVALAAAPYPSNAQPVKAGAADELIKSIGLVKPAMFSAPDFNLLDANGSPVGLSGYRGKMVLLNFWATWCGPCREEMPSMEQLSRNFGAQSLAVVAVNQRESPALVNRFMKTHGLNFTVPMDTTGRVAGYYRVYGIPVSYLIDGDGKVIGMKSGPLDWASPAVVNALRKLVGDADRPGGSMDLAPAKPLPTVLRAKADGVVVRGQHDVLAEAVGKVGRGEELIPLGKVSGAGEFWYMVKIGSGGFGWVRGGDVEEVEQRR